MQTKDLPRDGTMETAYPSVVREYLELQPDETVLSAAKGQLVLQEGDFADHSILLLDGWMALYKTLPEGEVQIFDVMLPGDFALIGARIAPVASCSVEALSDARYMQIMPDLADSTGPGAGDFRALLAAAIVNLQARTSELMLRLGKGSAASRLSYGLIEIYVRLEARNLCRDGRFDLPMTQLQIGQFVGLSNVHVCRTMRRFEREGILTQCGGHCIQIEDIAALCEIAGIDLDAFRREILMRRLR
ncbi:MAG: Crp/Fnr family transcriptional regulator [Rhodobacteraceae bacterium]|nr:Crp/Fnr family transcriptional regulator [Paracoccaceae bacterium]